MALKPDCCSARWSEANIDSIAACTSTTTPLRMPCEGQMPTPRISGRSASTAAIRVQILVVPTSMPTTICSRPMIVPPLVCSRSSHGASTNASHQLPTNDGEIIEESRPKGDDGSEVQLNTQAVSQVGKSSRQQHIRAEPSEEYVVTVLAIQLGR